MSTRSGRIRTSVKEVSPPRTRKGVSPPRSPARTRKSSPPAPPSSRKSPSRKSPSRKPASKFPARKSPSRTTKEATETAAQKSPGKRASIKSGPTVRLQELSKIEIYRSTRSKGSGYSVSDLSSGISQNESLSSENRDKVNGVDSLLESNDTYALRTRNLVDEIAPRRSTRLREVETVPDIRRSLSKSTSKSISKSVSQSIEISDSDDSETELVKRKSESMTRKLHTPLRESISKVAQIGSKWEFGGRIGSAALIFLLPLTIFGILISCTKSCSIRPFSDLTTLNSLSVWFSTKSLIVISTQFCIQAVFALIPIFGTKADRMDDTGTKYNFNAFFSSIFTANFLLSLHYFKVFDAKTLLNDYLKLAATSYVFAVFLSILLYLKSLKKEQSKLNPYGITEHVVYDFFVGREIHPFIKNLDVKIWISRISNINTLILALLLFKSSFRLPEQVFQIALINSETLDYFVNQINLKPALFIYSLMQIIYTLNFIVDEHKIANTFFWQSEGLGYLQLVTSALYPFYFTTISKFVADAEVSMSRFALFCVFAVFLSGFLIMVSSNNVKYEFRSNPLAPSWQLNLDSMPTFHGKKLLVSSFWGIVRHPNYAGDILMHAIFAIPGVMSQQYIAAAPALLTVVLLLHRAWRDHSRCRRRYGAAWERYCKRVPKVLIPKIF